MIQHLAGIYMIKHYAMIGSQIINNSFSTHFQLCLTNESSKAHSSQNSGPNLVVRSPKGIPRRKLLSSGVTHGIPSLQTRCISKYVRNSLSTLYQKHPHRHSGQLLQQTEIIQSIKKKRTNMEFKDATIICTVRSLGTVPRTTTVPPESLRFCGIDKIMILP